MLSSTRSRSREESCIADKAAEDDAKAVKVLTDDELDELRREMTEAGEAMQSTLRMRTGRAALPRKNSP
jgi:hypothetical protein